MHIHRYRVKKNVVPPESNEVIYGRQTVRLSEDGSITLSRDINHRPAADMENQNFDLDFFIVLDELVRQPYSAFYSYLDYEDINDENCSQFVLSVIKRYNQTMDRVEWLERVR